MGAPDQTFVGCRHSAKQILLAKVGGNTESCGVIGLGFIGSVLMDALIANRVEVHGFDRAGPAVARFAQRVARHRSADGKPFGVSNQETSLAGCDVLFVAVRNPVSGRRTDDEPLRAAAQLLRGHRKRPRLVLLESTVTPGTTRRLAAEIGADGDPTTFIAHAPERLSAGQDHGHLRSIPHVIGGIDVDSTEVGAAVLRKICNTVVPVSSPEISETAKLLENAFLSVNIALVGEVTRLCASLGVRATEVCDAAASKPSGFLAFHPGAGLGGHCLPNDLSLLAESLRSHGLEPALLDGAIAVNEAAPSLVIERLRTLMARRGLALEGAAVLLVGVGFKAGSADTTRSPAIDIVRLLRMRGAAPVFADSQVPEFRVDERAVRGVGTAEATRGDYGAAIILSGDAALPAETLAACARVVLYAGGSRRHLPAVPEVEFL